MKTTQITKELSKINIPTNENLRISYWILKFEIRNSLFCWLDSCEFVVGDVFISTRIIGSFKFSVLPLFAQNVLVIYDVSNVLRCEMSKILCNAGAIFIG